MNFTLSTKPLADALALGVINSNVSKFYSKSCIAQITATESSLTINLEAARIVSEIVLKGKGDEVGPVSVFVDSLLFKQLVSTFETSTVTLEFADGGLILHSGKSKFTLAKMADGEELSLKKLTNSLYVPMSVTFDKADWRFIKDRQMYAIAMAFIHPIYTRVWVGSDGGVIVGDYDNGLFTYSQKNKLNSTCLLSDTIINLFNSIPDNSKLSKVSDTKYQITVENDGFVLRAEFTPEYEDDENVGSYMSGSIISMMDTDPDSAVSVNTGVLKKFLSQADLLSTGSDATIKLGVSAGQLYLKDSNVDCNVEVAGNRDIDFSLEFKTAFLKSVIADYPDESVFIRPVYQDSEITGILVWSAELTTVLAGVD